MIPSDSKDRAVAPVIGFILLFGMAVIAFSMFQATVVPNQNSQVEAAHYSDVRGDLATLRGGLITAGQTSSTQIATVSLGTTYPSRLVALNAPPPAGQLQTQSVGPGRYISSNLNLRNICGYGNQSSVSTSAIVYQPNYHYFEGGDYDHRLEATLLYQVTDGQPLVRQTQSLVDPNSKTVSLYPIQDSLDTQGVTGESVDLVGNLSGETTSADFTLTVPTRAGVKTWDEKVSNSVVVSDNPEYENAVDLTFSGSWTVKCHPVGLGDAPSQPVIPEGTNENEDTEPPQFSSGPSATPNPVTQGESFELDATIDNIGRGGSDIISATWSDDQGNGGDLAAGDGTFDQPTETVSSTIDTVDWSSGDHTITVVGTDATGQTVSKSITVTVTDPAQGDNPPTATIESITDNSRCQEGNPNDEDPCSAQDYAEFRVQWSADDDNELATVTINLIDSNGNVVDQRTNNIGGTSASNNADLRHTGGYGDTYAIEVTVTDNQDQSNTASEDHRADADDVGDPP